jgi:hypothetical protein
VCGGGGGWVGGGWVRVGVYVPVCVCVRVCVCVNMNTGVLLTMVDYCLYTSREEYFALCTYRRALVEIMLLNL